MNSEKKSNNEKLDSSWVSTCAFLSVIFLCLRTSNQKNIEDQKYITGGKDYE